MLYWLISQEPHASRTLMMTVFGILPIQDDVYTTTVEREWRRHVDLFVDSGMGAGRLVLENKLHALPDLDQLERLYRDLPEMYRNDHTSFILLSLIPPHGRLPQPWRHVDYADLIWPCRDAADQLDDQGTRFEAELLRQYAQLLTHLVALRDRYTAADLRAVLDPTERTQLREARLLPLVEKLRIARLVDAIRSRLAVTAEIRTGFSNTSAFAQSFFRGHDRHQFGWQYQAGQLRLAVILDKPEQWRNRRHARELRAEEYTEFFDFAAATARQDLLAPTGSTVWRGYEPDFVYQYRKIDRNVTLEQLADLCVDLTAHAHHYATTPKRTRQYEYVINDDGAPEYASIYRYTRQGMLDAELLGLDGTWVKATNNDSIARIVYHGDGRRATREEVVEFVTKYRPSSPVPAG